MLQDGAADYLYGGAGNDLIIGQDGDDFLWGEQGDDILWGDDNREDSISGNDTLLGGEGSDKLYGGKGNDTLYGGTGYNILDGGEGNDQYILLQDEFNGRANNIIKDSDGSGSIWVNNVELGSKTWTFNTDAQKWKTDNLDVLLMQRDTDLLIMNRQGIVGAEIKDFTNGKLGIQLNDQTDTGNTGSTDDSANNGSTDNGSVNNGSTDNGSVSNGSTDNGSTDNGSTDNGSVSNGSTNHRKTIVSGSKNETLKGNAGTDDTYIFGKRFGQDTVINPNPQQKDEDILKFTHTKLTDVQIYRSNHHLKIVRKDGQSVTVKNFFTDDAKGNYTVQAVEFADGKRLNTEQLRQAVLKSTRGNDTLHAYAEGSKINDGYGNDRLIGHAGNDYLSGGDGNDVLSGGKGDDRLEGGKGHDTYLFNLGDGHDHLYDSYGKDVLKLGAGISRQDLWFSRNGHNLSIQVLGKKDQVTIEGWFDIVSHKIETIQTGDGAQIDVGGVWKMVQAMAAFAPKQGSGLNVDDQMKDYSQQLLAADNVWK